jgi:hypothetical protein
VQWQIFHGNLGEEPEKYTEMSEEGMGQSGQ